MMDKLWSYWFFSAVKDLNSNTIYFFGNNIKGFFAWDLTNNEVELIDELVDTPVENGMYDYGVIYNDIIYFPPKNANDIAIYEINSRKMRFLNFYTVEILNIIKYNPKLLIGHLILIADDEYVYFACRQYPVVIKFNVRTESFEYIFAEEYPFDEIELSKSFYKKGDLFYLPLINKGAVLVFDIKTGKLSFLIINNDLNNGFTSCIQFDEKLFLLTRDSKYLVEFNLLLKNITNHEINLAKGSLFNSQMLLKYKEKVYIIPLNDNIGEGVMRSIYLVDFSTFELLEISVFDNYLPNKKQFVFEDEYYEYFFSFQSTYHEVGDLYWPLELEILKLNMETLMVERIELPCPKGYSGNSISQKVQEEQSEIYIKNFGITNENPRTGLPQFLNYVKK